MPCASITTATDDRPECVHGFMIKHKRRKNGGVSWVCKEYRRLQNQAYRDRHQDSVKLYNSAYYQAHKARSRELGRAWYEANKPTAQKSRDEWRKRNPEHWRVTEGRRRARETGAFIGPSWSRNDLIKRDGLVCHLCSVHIDLSLKCPDPLSFSEDHVIPLSKGGPHSFENVKPAHLGCNASKGNRVKETTCSS